jgi:hypothetical protein
MMVASKNVAIAVVEHIFNSRVRLLVEITETIGVNATYRTQNIG